MRRITSRIGRSDLQIMSALLESFLTVRTAIRLARYANRLSGNGGKVNR